MSDTQPEGEAILETETTPEIEEAETDDQTIEQAEETETEELDAAESDEQPEDDGLEELEWNGKKFRAPKDIQAALMKDADYTRKTQEVAATRKELEQAREALNQKFQAAEQEIQLVGVLKQAQDALEQYQNLTEADWNEWKRSNPEEADANWRRFTLMERAAAQGKVELEALQTARVEQAKQETAKRLAATREYAEKNIKGWTPEFNSKLTEFATKELGFELGEVVSVMRPQVYRAIYLAQIGLQALQKTATAKPAPSPVQPLETIKPKGNPVVRKSLNEMSMEEHAALFKKQQEARKRA